MSNIPEKASESEIVEYAWNYANKYRKIKETASVATGDGLRHPTVFVWFDGPESEALESLRQFSRPGMFFCVLPSGIPPSMEPSSCNFSSVAPSLNGRPTDDSFSAELSAAVRSVKSEIQRNTARLNIKRINVSVIIPPTMAYSQERDYKKAGQLLAGLFGEDFPIVHLSLFVLLSESNSQNNFEARSAASLRLLQQIKEFQKEEQIYRLVWLLSDRNEHDVVSEENFENNLAIIGFLHSFSAHSDSNFEDSLKSHYKDKGEAIFVTAGMAQLTKPYKEIGFSVFRKTFISIADSEIQPTDNVSDAKTIRDTHMKNFVRWDSGSVTTQVLTSFVEHPVVLAAVGVAVSEEDMLREMESIAINKINGRVLHKKSIREAEEQLFGKRAKLFYDANYKMDDVDNLKEILAQVLDMVQDHIGCVGLSAANQYRDGYLPEAIADLDNRITGYSQEIELRCQSLYIHKPFRGISGAISAIAGIYAVRSQMERLGRLRYILGEIQKEFVIFCARCEEFSQLLDREVESLKKVEVPGLHIPEYYGQLTDKILTQIDGKINLKNYIGSAYSVLTDGGLLALASKVAEFINEHIITDAAFQLSFEEDQEARAVISPHSYDRDFTDKNEFYGQLLKEADFRAALAVSLKGYDHLIFERYYLGDTNGPCMGYAREHGQKGINESVYFFEDATGFKVLRLSGGFILEDLARYEAMENYLQMDISRL